MELSSQKFFPVKSSLDEVGGKGMNLHLNFVRVLRLQKQQYLEEHTQRFSLFQDTPLIHGMKKDLTNNSEFLCRRCPHPWQGLEGEECQGPFQPKPCWDPVNSAL